MELPFLKTVYFSCQVGIVNKSDTCPRMAALLSVHCMVRQIPISSALLYSNSFEPVSKKLTEQVLCESHVSH
jgi:hypothetical protein